MDGGDENAVGGASGFGGGTAGSGGGGGWGRALSLATLAVITDGFSAGSIENAVKKTLTTQVGVLAVLKFYIFKL